MNEIINFWELWKSYSKRNKTNLKKIFCQKAGMKQHTLNSVLNRKNFTFEEQKIWRKIIGLPLTFETSKNEIHN